MALEADAADRGRLGLLVAGPRTVVTTAEEDRAEQVGTVGELGGGPAEADVALLQEHRALGELQGDVDRLLDDDDGRARPMDATHRLHQLADHRGREPE